MERVALDLGIIQIYWYSIFIFLGILAASIVIYNESTRKGIDKDFVVNLAFNTIIFGVLGARIYYVLFRIDSYLSNPLQILKIRDGGLAIYGGIIAIVLFVSIYCKVKKINFLNIRYSTFFCLFTVLVGTRTPLCIFLL